MSAAATNKNGAPDQGAPSTTTNEIKDDTAQPRWHFDSCYRSEERTCMACRTKFRVWYADNELMPRCDACCAACQESGECPVCGEDGAQ